MSDLNRCTFTGRVTRDPRLQATTTGTPVLSFGLAVNDAERNPETGEWGDRPNFIDVVVFGSRAEGLSKVLGKGRLVSVDAKARWRSWEQDGERRTKIEFRADDVELLGPKPKPEQD